MRLIFSQLHKQLIFSTKKSITVHEQYMKGTIKLHERYYKGT